MKWGGGPDTIYPTGGDTSPWLPNGFLHFTQLFPLRKSYQSRPPLRGPETPQRTDALLSLSISEGYDWDFAPATIAKEARRARLMCST